MTGNAGGAAISVKVSMPGVAGAAAGGRTLAVTADVADDQGGRAALAVGARSGG